MIDTLAVGVDRIQRNFEPTQRQIELWRSSQISDESAKLILYKAFVDGELEPPRTLLPEVHRLSFEPEYPEFSPRTMWSLSSAFTSAFKKLDPIPQFKAQSQAGSVSQSIDDVIGSGVLFNPISCGNGTLQRVDCHS